MDLIWNDANMCLITSSVTEVCVCMYIDSCGDAALPDFGSSITSQKGCQATEILELVPQVVGLFGSLSRCHQHLHWH